MRLARGAKISSPQPTAQQAWTYDLLGNRLWKNYMMSGVQRYVYDELNRATSICGAQVGAAYTYRADGMRVQKVSGLTIA